MKSTYSEGVLKILLPKRIDTNNADKFEEELKTTTQIEGVKQILLDAQNLTCISSAGLRIIRELLDKQKESSVFLINASSKVHEIFHISGFNEIMEVMKKLRRVNIKDMESIGGGLDGSIYRVNDEQILKVLHNIDSPTEIEKIVSAIRLAFVNGIPTIIPFEIVETERGAGMIMEFIDSELLSAVMRDNSAQFDYYVQKMVELHKRVTSVEFESGRMRKIGDMLKGGIDSAANLLAPEEISEIKGYIDIIPKENTGLHGDFHAKNIMVMKGELILIDMDDFSVGHPVWDFSSVYQDYRMIPHLDYETEDTIVDFESNGITSQRDFHFDIFGFTLDESDKLWDKFFDYCFLEYSEEDKADFLESAKFCSLLTFINSIIIDFCHRTGGDLPKNAARIGLVRRYLNEVRAFDTEKIRRTLLKWPKGKKEQKSRDPIY